MSHRSTLFTNSAILSLVVKEKGINCKKFFEYNRFISSLILSFQGSFRIHGIKASRQMFLFERGVIIAKRKEDGMLSCKVYIPVNLVYFEC